jgi:dephospho-CoA kinase
MSPESEQLIRESWHQIEPELDRFSALFYAQLFEIDPALRALFVTSAVAAQQQKFAGMLSELGAAVIDADALARSIRQNDGEARAEIEAEFGTLEPRELAEIVFSDPGALQRLEAVIHPRVRNAVRERLAELTHGDVPAAVVEAIKLLESPLHDRCDETWVVTCTEADALARLAATRRMGEAAARARLANQSPQEEKVAAADVVIDGSARLDETRRQVEEAYRRLVSASD